MTATVAETAFTRESELRTARRYADRDIHGTAPATEVNWLYEHPMLWLRALTGMRRDVQTHIAKDRKSLSALRPVGAEPGPVYFEAKRASDERCTRRLHFLQRIEQRVDEVEALLGAEPLPPYWSLGNLIGVLTDVGEMADAGDLAAAADKAFFHARRLRDRAKSDGQLTGEQLMKQIDQLVALRIGALRKTEVSPNPHEAAKLTAKADELHARLQAMLTR